MSVRRAFGRAIRDQWLFPETLAFLNHGSYGAVPRPVLEAQNRLRNQLEADPVRFLHWARFGGLRAALAGCAPFLGARPQDLVFVENATTGVAAVLHSVRVEPGDVLLTTSHAYGAVLRALRHLASRTGATVEVVDVPFPIEGPDQVVEAVRARLRPEVRLAVLDWITSATGLVFPIERLVRACQEAGVPVLVDGAHVPGHVPCDLGALGADWFVGNAHKWLFAPRGTAFLHAKPERQGELHPAVVSWGYGEGWQAEFNWVGTRDYTAWLCAPEGLAFYRALDPEAARSWCVTLREEAAALISAAWGQPRPAPPEMLGNLCTLALPFLVPPDEAAAAAVHEALWERHGIEVPVFPFGDRCWLRISTQVYNSLDEYERLAAAVGPEGVR